MKFISIFKVLMAIFFKVFISFCYESCQLKEKKPTLRGKILNTYIPYAKQVVNIAILIILYSLNISVLYPISMYMLKLTSTFNIIVTYIEIFIKFII